MTKQEYNLLTADLFDRLPLPVIESPQGQAVIQYFCEKLTTPRPESEEAGRAAKVAYRANLPYDAMGDYSKIDGTP